MPWPRRGRSIMGARDGKRPRRRPPTGPRATLLGDHLAALGRAVLLAHLHPALALAAVLAGAAVRRALARALALALVDARTLDLVAALGARNRRHRRREHPRHRRRYQGTFHRHIALLEGWDP